MFIIDGFYMVITAIEEWQYLKRKGNRHNGIIGKRDLYQRKVEVG